MKIFFRKEKKWFVNNIKFIYVKSLLIIFIRNLSVCFYETKIYAKLFV